MLKIKSVLNVNYCVVLIIRTIMVKRLLYFLVKSKSSLARIVKKLHRSTAGTFESLQHHMNINESATQAQSKDFTTQML